MIPSQYSKADRMRAAQTLEAVFETIARLIDWNKDIQLVEDYYSSPTGMQLLAANCTLITAIGEGINRVNRVLPEFLSSQFPEIPWRAIIGMRNNIAHGYFELDADIVFDSIKNDIPSLCAVIEKALDICKS